MLKLGNLTPSTDYTIKLEASSHVSQATAFHGFSTKAATTPPPPPNTPPPPGSERLQVLDLAITPTLYSLNFAWRTPGNSSARVEIGQYRPGTSVCDFTETKNTAAVTRRGMTFHSVAFEGLTHTTEYCYRITLTAVENGRSLRYEEDGRAATLEGRTNLVARLLSDPVITPTGPFNEATFVIEIENVASPTTIATPPGMAVIARVEGFQCALACGPFNVTLVPDPAQPVGDGRVPLDGLAPGQAKTYSVGRRDWTRKDQGGGSAELFVEFRVGAAATGEQRLPVLLPRATADLRVGITSRPGPNRGEYYIDITTGNDGPDPALVSSFEVTLGPGVRVIQRSGFCYERAECFQRAMCLCTTARFPTGAGPCW
jgi:hypothetical protein